MRAGWATPQAFLADSIKKQCPAIVLTTKSLRGEQNSRPRTYLVLTSNEHTMSTIVLYATEKHMQAFHTAVLFPVLNEHTMSTIVVYATEVCLPVVMIQKLTLTF